MFYFPLLRFKSGCSPTYPNFGQVLKINNSTNKSFTEWLLRIYLINVVRLTSGEGSSPPMLEPSLFSGYVTIFWSSAPHIHISTYNDTNLSHVQEILQNRRAWSHTLQYGSLGELVIFLCRRYFNDETKFTSVTKEKTFYPTLPRWQKTFL